MIYSNDEADKRERRKNFYLTVYVIPGLFILATVVLLYWFYLAGHIVIGDFIYGSVLALTPAMLIHSLSRRHWLKMPDGTYHNIKGEASTGKTNFNEPTEYEAEYFYSKTQKSISFIMGLGLIGLSSWFYVLKDQRIIFIIGTLLTGVFLSYIGLKGLLDTTAKLKIAKNGLWTKKLGFVNWDDINYAEVVVEDKKQRLPQTFLKIRLKGTKFEEADQPDQILLLNDLGGEKDIEMVINQSIINYNNQKKVEDKVV